MRSGVQNIYLFTKKDETESPRFTLTLRTSPGAAEAERDKNRRAERMSENIRRRKRGRRGQSERKGKEIWR